ncbi:hypothetical protein ABPG75_009385 [Micractinium tetrahymenae]
MSTVPSRLAARSRALTAFASHQELASCRRRAIWPCAAGAALLPVQLCPATCLPATPPVPLPQMGAALSSSGKRLHAAIKRGQLEKFERLLARFPSAAQARKRRSGRLPLHTAALHSQAACVSALLKAGANAEAQDADANTALHAAAEAGSVECVQLLLAANAHPCAANGSGHMPEQLAERSGHAEVVTLLRQASSSPEARAHAPPPAAPSRAASAQREMPSAGLASSSAPSSSSGNAFGGFWNAILSDPGYSSHNHGHHGGGFYDGGGGHSGGGGWGDGGCGGGDGGGGGGGGD